MSAIKDVYDLSKELKESVTDTKQLGIIMAILNKIEEAERENLELEKSQFQLERKHHEEMSQLKTRISELESQLESKAKPFVGSIPLTKA